MVVNSVLTLKTFTKNSINGVKLNISTYKTETRSHFNCCLITPSKFGTWPS
jgi:hypothetical protein